MKHPIRQDSIDVYVERHNIERYRRLLQSRELDPERRAAILKLLAQEEARQAARPPDGQPKHR